MNNETSYFLFQIISFKKYFYVSLSNNFLTVLWKPPPLVVEAPGQLAQFAVPYIRPWPQT